MRTDRIDSLARCRWVERDQTALAFALECDGYAAHPAPEANAAHFAHEPPGRFLPIDQRASLCCEAPDEASGTSGLHAVLAELKPRHVSQELAYTRSNAGPIRSALRARVLPENGRF